MKLEDFVRQKVQVFKEEKIAQTETLLEKIYQEARDLATSSPGLKNAESGLGERTGAFLKSITKRKVVEPDGSLAFEVYYDKSICSYADYIENGTRRIKPFKILATAYDNILSGGK